MSSMHVGMHQSVAQVQVQKQILAPRMIQSMEVLQMPILRLEERIKDELSENPVMELREANPDDDGQPSDDGADQNDLSTSDPDSEELVIDSSNNESDFDRLDALNRDWQDHFNEEHRPSRNSIQEASDKKHDAMQNLASRPESLVDHLNEQLMLLDSGPEHLDFVQVLIDNLDERGYLSSALELLAHNYSASLSLPDDDEEKPKKKDDTRFDVAQAELAWNRVQRLRPDQHSTEELRQLLLMSDPPRHLPFHVKLIEALNGRGELKSPLELLVEWHAPELAVHDAEKALAVLQQLDPPGVGARDLRECLLLQLGPDLPHVDLVRQLILHHLEDIQHNRMPVIERSTGADLETIQEAIEELRHLNPRPAASFGASINSYVVPDLAVELGDDGEYQVRLLDDWVPEVYVPLEFRHMVRDPNLDNKTREYLKQRIQRVDWLREAIEQRRSTLKKVAEAIVRHQRAFFDLGPEHIEPLKMQQIADQVKVHVTTVSRAVDKKYAETPRGIFPLKRFFGGGKVVNGEEIAWENIKRKLLEIIESEDKANPLSDEDLVAALEKANHPIKRRTVTKYREKLGIPSSRERKDWSLSNGR